MGVHDRDWYRPRHDFGARRRGETWRALRGLTVIAIVVMIVFTFGKTLFRKAGAVGAPGNPTSFPEPRLPYQAPTRVLTAPAHERASTSTYHCIVNGALVYSGPEDCRRSMEAVPSQVASPPRGSGSVSGSDGLTPYQREMLRSADLRIARDASAAQAEMQASRQRAASVSGECSALADEVLALDSAARQPLGGGTQDRIRARRQEVRSRQAALRC